MHTYKLNFFFILSILVLFSCKKEESNENIKFPQDLILYNISKTSKVRLITNKKEIKDTSIINKFIKDTDIFEIKEPTGIGLSYITFLSKDKAHFAGYDDYTIITSGNQFLYYSDSAYYIFESWSKFLHNCLKYSYPLTPIQQGSTINFITKDVRVGYGKYQAQDFQYFAFKYHSIYGVTWCAYFANEFNEDAIGQIQENDTLAFQCFSFSTKAK
jgi:hypothetical protein